MGNLLGAALLVLTTPCFAKPVKASAPAAAKHVTVSTAALGTELVAYAASTEAITMDLVSRRFAETDVKIKSLKMTFRQFVRLEGSDTVQSVEGALSFKKPEFLRLTHTVPEPQTVVSDGTWLWVYRKSTNQVIQSRVEAWRKSEPLAQGLLDFGASADLLTRYDAAITTVTAPGADGHRVVTVTLMPKTAKKGADAEFVLTLKVSTKDWFPGDATLKVGRASIRSVFENVRLNPDLPDETFKFTPPADADLFKTPEPK